MSNPHIEKFMARAKQLNDEGLSWTHAFGITDLEKKIENWPKDWGDDFVILIFGDFDPLDHELHLKSLKIRVLPEKIENSVVKNVRTVHRAIVGIEDKSIASVLDAVKRVNILLGVFSLVTWTNCYCDWWSHMTHEIAGGGVRATLAADGLEQGVDGIVSMAPAARAKVEAALYWLRMPKKSMFTRRLNVQDTFAAYWNAFECLVEACSLIQPRGRLSRKEKQDSLDQLVKNFDGKITPAFIQEAYREIVNPGFRSKAEHALRLCFGDLAQGYIDECFRIPSVSDRLYDIRNAINHGSIDSENPEENVRIQSRLSVLSVMLLGIFGRFVPYSYPVDRPQR